MSKKSIRRALAGAGAASATAVALAVVPGLASAGKTVYGGSQSLKVTESLSPQNAGSTGTTLAVHVDYESTKPGQRIMAATHEIRLDLPEDATINPKNAGVCDAVKFINSKGDPKVCPAGSVVGEGTITADARPTLPDPVKGTLTLYNAKGKHNDIIFYVHTQYENFSYIFNILTSDDDGDHDIPTRLDVMFDPPSRPSLFTLRTIDLKIHNSSTGKPYLSNPPKCPGSAWLDGIYISNFSGEPNLYAQDATSCLGRSGAGGVVGRTKRR